MLFLNPGFLLGGRPQHPQVPLECRPARRGLLPPSLPPPSPRQLLPDFVIAHYYKNQLRQRKKGSGEAVMDRRGLSASPGGGAPRAGQGAVAPAPPSDTEALGSGSAQGETEAVFRGAGSPTNVGSTWGPTADGPGRPGSPGGSAPREDWTGEGPCAPQSPGASCQSGLGPHASPGHSYPSDAHCPPRTAGPQCSLPRPPRAASPTKAPLPNSQARTHLPDRESLPHSQPGHGRGVGAAAALHHCLHPTWCIKPAARRKPQSPGGGGG